jgi:hypothetical protein
MLSKPTTLNQQCTKCRNVESKKESKNRNQMANMNQKINRNKEQQKTIAKKGGKQSFLLLSPPL